MGLASTSITVCETQIPKLKDSLETVTATCTSELKTLDANIAVVSGDVDVMTEIVKMTKCSKDDSSTTTTKKPGGSSFVMYTCEDECGGKYNTFMGADKFDNRTQALAKRLLEDAEEEG